MTISSYVFQTVTTLLPIHQVCVTTGIVHSVSLPVSHIVCYKKSNRHNHYHMSRGGWSSCFPNIRGSLLLRKKILGGKTNCLCTAESRQLLPLQLVPEGRLEISRRAEEHCVAHSGRQVCPFPFVQPDSRWLHGVWLGPWFNCGGQWCWLSVLCAGTEAVGGHLHEESPGRREHPVFLVLIIWISGSSPSSAGR